METLVWILAGGALGWASHRYFGFNESRGALISALIGVVGAMIGGKAIAPLIITAAATSGDVGMPALLVALAAAAGALALGDRLQRWGV
jgi:uncharacterized membrane protein YeaQ/YmgE (transglycosylase-associated protein family)